MWMGCVQWQVVLRTSIGASGLYKQRRISLLGKEVLVSQGLCFLELIMIANCLRTYRSLHVSYSLFVELRCKLVSLARVLNQSVVFTRTEELCCLISADVFSRLKGNLETTNFCFARFE